MNKSTPIKFQFKTQSYVKGVPVNITVTPENLLKIFYIKNIPNIEKYNFVEINFDGKQTLLLSFAETQLNKNYFKIYKQQGNNFILLEKCTINKSYKTKLIDKLNDSFADILKNSPTSIAFKLNSELMDNKFIFKLLPIIRNSFWADSVNEVAGAMLKNELLKYTVNNNDDVR
jgi:hypothetical protein